MQILNKENRLKYLAFNDVGFMLIGIPLLSFVADFIVSNNSFGRLPFLEATINWSVSLVFSICNWLVMRSILVQLRKKHPSIKDNRKRIPLIFIFIVATVTTVDYLGNLALGYIFGDNYSSPLRSKIILPIVVISTMIMAIYEAVYFYVLLKKAIRQEEEAKRAVVQAQLDALRNQSKPHFFFNAMNTLRDIIDQNSKEEAKEFVNQLSQVYRFILEAGNRDLIPLNKEVAFAKGYIHIQQERFGENLQLEWDLGNPTGQMMIVPMGLHTLLENAIKHNVISRTKPLQIIVKVSGERLSVQNKIQPKTSKLPSTGLGLKNLKERYALLSHQEVVISQANALFTVTIPLLAHAPKNERL